MPCQYEFNEGSVSPRSQAVVTASLAISVVAWYGDFLHHGVVGLLLSGKGADPILRIYSVEHSDNGGKTWL